MPTKPGGKNGTKFISVDEMWTLFEQYRKKVKSQPFIVEDWVGGAGKPVKRKKEKPLTIEGFENFIAEKGIAKDLQRYIYNVDLRYNDYIEVVVRVRRTIRQDQIEGGMAMIYNPSITQRINNLVEKTENKHEVNEIIIKHES